MDQRWSSRRSSLRGCLKSGLDLTLAPPDPQFWGEIVSPQAKQALEEAGIRGLQFFPKKGVRADTLAT